MSVVLGRNIYLRHRLRHRRQDSRELPVKEGGTSMVRGGCHSVNTKDRIFTLVLPFTTPKRHVNITGCVPYCQREGFHLHHSPIVCHLPAAHQCHGEVAICPGHQLANSPNSDHSAHSSGTSMSWRECHVSVYRLATSPYFRNDSPFTCSHSSMQFFQLVNPGKNGHLFTQ